METYNTSPSPEFMIIYAAVVVPLSIIYIISAWKIYIKAGQPGWASIVPFYNILCLLRIVGKPEWWLILYFIPFANLYSAISVAVNLAKKFGKNGMFGFFGLFIFPFIGFPILAFGKANYDGASTPTPPVTTPPAPTTTQSTPTTTTPPTPPPPLKTDSASPSDTPIINHAEQTTPPNPTVPKT